MARVPLSWLMGLVAVVALGLAAMRVGSPLACALVMETMLLALCVASLGSVVRPAPAAAWRGFALFGWVYVGSTFLRPDLGWGAGAPLPLGDAIELTADRLHPAPTPPPRPSDPAVLAIRFDRDGQPTSPAIRAAGGPTTAELEAARRYHDARSAHTDAVIARAKSVENATRIGHASLTIAFGLLGAVAGRVMSSHAWGGEPRAARRRGAGASLASTPPPSPLAPEAAP